MKRLRMILLLTAAVGLACSRTNEYDRLYHRLLVAQDNRDPADSIYPYLNMDRLQLTYHALSALGRLQDTAATDTLIGRLNPQESYLTGEAIWALGQIGDAAVSVSAKNKIESALIKYYPKDGDAYNRALLLEALGRCGDTPSFTVISRALEDTAAGIQAAAAKACAYLAMRHIRHAGLDSGLMKLFIHPVPAVRWSAVYAMMRIQNPFYAQAVLSRLRDDDWRVRMDAARALGTMNLDKTKNPLRRDIINALVETASNDTVWQVRVNAVSALGGFKLPPDDLKKVYFLIAFEGKKDNNAHVRIAAIRAMARSYRNDIKAAGSFIDDFVVKFLPQARGTERGEIHKSLIRMFGAAALRYEPFFKIYENDLKSPDRYLRAICVEALDAIREPFIIPVLESCLKDSFKLVRINALNGLASVQKEESRLLLESTLNDTDLVIVSAAATALASDSVIIHNPVICERISKKIGEALKQTSVNDEETILEIFHTLETLKAPSAPGILQNYLRHPAKKIALEAAAVLQSLTGTSYADSIKTVRPRYTIDYESLASIQRMKPFAVIETPKGNIELDLYVDDAPLTVLHFIKLCENKFYDGHTVHRVVPNFVIQDGDPEGSGWGGPGYAIRSEFSPRQFERGVVGMASAGKDTEGSQWFIMHAPHPHLNGHYTAFAKVRNGMDVVDRIQVGDSIRTIKIFRIK